MIIFIFALFVIEALMAALWWQAYRIQKTSTVDIFWSLLIWLAALIYFFALSGKSHADTFYLFLVTCWAWRLAGHIYFRSRDHGEDARYAELRQKWGGEEKKRMLVFYLQQGVAAWIFSLPFFILFSSKRETLGAWELAGAFIWLQAVIGESLSDWQLARFKKNPQNKDHVCREGYWRYSRHPNYFFEWLHWVAYAWLALPHAWGIAAVICPVLMYFFLTRVSGIPLAEKQALKNRPEEYREYQRITSPFFPFKTKHSEILK